MILLLFGLLIVSEKTVEVRYTVIAPKIDGVIEDIWHEADSAYGFVQYRPNEGDAATEPSIVRVLADDNNLYFAFLCLTPTRKPVASFSGAEDQIFLYLDTFRNKTASYFFNVCASGIKEDGLILEDGKIWDRSWDGVWYYGVNCYDNRFEVEIKIPFKSIRYKKELNEWGANFQFWSVKGYEVSYWVPVKQKDNLQVSKFGRLTNINPKSTGYYAELYPEAFFKYDKIVQDERYRPSASFNFKWDLTSQTTLNATVNPDFAHIEADPYTLNLSRYPIRLSERRPFFIEGSDVFRMSSLGRSFFTPLETFYSRQIGKPLPEGGSIPILGGLKFVGKEKKWNYGILTSLTHETNTDPYQSFGVLRTKQSILENSEIGILLSSAFINKDDYNYAVSIDGVYRHGSSQYIIQSSFSDKSSKRGWAVSTGSLYNSEKFLAQASFLAVHDSFDVSNIGYVPWGGLINFYISAGRQWFSKSRMISRFFMGPGFTLKKEPGSDDWSKILNFTIEPQLRNLWGFSFNLEAGEKFEAETNYFYRRIYASIWSGFRTQYETSFGTSYAYCYNYRQSWLANQFASWFWLELYPVSPLSISASVDFVVEWNPDGDIVAITPYTTPRIEYKINKDMKIVLYSEFVMQTEGNNLKSTEIYSNRIGFLFSWNFLPKSWLYVAFNDYRENAGVRLELQERIGAIKAKYLIYF